MGRACQSRHMPIRNQILKKEVFVPVIGRHGGHRKLVREIDNFGLNGVNAICHKRSSTALCLANIQIYRRAW
jgi:hypothetical protein